MEDVFRLVNLVVDNEYSNSTEDDCVLVGEVWNLSKKQQRHLVDKYHNSGPSTWITNNSKQYGYESGYQEPWINNGQYPEWTNNNNGWCNGYNVMDSLPVDEWIRYYRNACVPWIRNGDFLEPLMNGSKWKSGQSMFFSVIIR